MKAYALLMLLFSSACAAGQAPADAMRQPPPIVQYERILGSFAIESSVPIYLNPALAERMIDARDYMESELDAIVSEFERKGRKRGEATARFNHAVVLWHLDRPEEAYREMNSAQAIFERAGDFDGLARSHEWLGFWFKESGEIETATDHLALSYQLFRKLENDSAAKRVLAYGE